MVRNIKCGYSFLGPRQRFGGALLFSACPSVCHSPIAYCGHSNLVILIRISSKFHICISSIKPWFKIEYEFSLTNDNQDGHRLSVCIHPLLRSLQLSHFYWISSKLHLWIASVNPWFKFEYEFCPTNARQHGRQNGRRLSVCIHPLLWSL